MSRRLFRARLGAIGLAIASAAPLCAQGAAANPYVPLGIFLAQIEEGGRIFTPARLLPKDHPEALGHDFPTVLQLHGTEFQALVWLGRQSGLLLYATLQRYPTEPAADWPYAAFEPPPDTVQLRHAMVVHHPRTAAPLPGLRAVLFGNRAPILFIVDTRGLTLAARGMRGATTMGLDVSRADFLAALGRAAAAAPAAGLWAVIYDG